MEINPALLKSLRNILDPLPHRELDPAAYIVAASNRTADGGTELSPEDKDLAHQLLIAALDFAPEE